MLGMKQLLTDIRLAATQVAARAPLLAEQLGPKIEAAKGAVAAVAADQIRNVQVGVAAVGEAIEDLPERASDFVYSDLPTALHQILDGAETATRAGIETHLSGNTAAAASAAAAKIYGTGRVLAGLLPTETENNAEQALEFVLGAMAGKGTKIKGERLQGAIAGQISTILPSRNVQTLLKLGQAADRIQDVLIPSLAGKKSDADAITRSLLWRLKNVDAADPQKQFNFFLINAWLTLEALYHPDRAAQIVDALRPQLIAKRPEWVRETDWNALISGNAALNAVRRFVA